MNLLFRQSGSIDVVLVMVLAIIAGLSLYAYNNYSSLSRQKVEGFRYVERGELTCAALIPECGYCPGEIIDKECYVE